MLNNVVLIGRLTRDPEIRYAPSTQMAIASFSIAIDRYSKPGAEKQTDFPRITVFGKQAENCEKFLSKGRLVAIQGRIQTGSYTNKDGNKVYTTDVVANNVQFLEWGDRKNGDDSSSYQSSGGGFPSGDMGLVDGLDMSDIAGSFEAVDEETPF